MGYVPPFRPVSFGYLEVREGPSSGNRMVLVDTYESYRWRLYGDEGRDWMPFLNAGLLMSVIALFVAAAYAVLG